MNTQIPRGAAIHDLSCFGRCALTVIIPTLSAMGVQVIPVPTALLSTHTGGFSDMSFLDLHDEMKNIKEHFLSLDMKFDAIYTGFLGSEAQIDTVEDFIRTFANDKCDIFVDPVMGDDGVLYSTYTRELMLGMRRLCRVAHVITPNLTEACFLTDTEYPDTQKMNEEEIKTLAEGLCERLFSEYGADVILTGLSFGENKVSTGALSGGKFKLFTSEHIGRNYPGTGDVFASVALGRRLSGANVFDAARSASEFTRRVIAYSEEFGLPARDGVVLEPMLGELKDSGRE